MVDFLLQQGAILLSTNAEGETAEQVAANQEISDFLSGTFFSFLSFIFLFLLSYLFFIFFGLLFYFLLLLFIPFLLFAGHVQVCFLQERIISVPLLEAEKFANELESNAKRLYGPSVKINFSPGDVLPGRETLVHVTLPKPSIILLILSLLLY